MKEKVKTFIVTEWYMYLFISGIVVIAIISDRMHIFDIPHEQMESVMLEGAFLAILWYITHHKKQSFVAKSIYTKPKNKFIAISSLLAINMFFWGTSIVFLLSKLQPIKEETLKFNKIVIQPKDELIIMSILIVAIMARIIEEILFRGFLYPLLKKHFPIKWALILQGILFGMLHIHAIDKNIIGINIMTVIAITVFGITYGYMLYKSGSIWPGIIMHMIQNLLCVVLLGQLPDEFEPSIYIIGIVFVIGTLSMWMLFKKIREYTIT